MSASQNCLLQSAASVRVALTTWLLRAGGFVWGASGETFTTGRAMWVGSAYPIGKCTGVLMYSWDHVTADSPSDPAAQPLPYRADRSIGAICTMTSPLCALGRLRQTGCGSVTVCDVDRTVRSVACQVMHPGEECSSRTEQMTDVTTKLSSLNTMWSTHCAIPNTREKVSNCAYESEGFRKLNNCACARYLRTPEGC